MPDDRLADALEQIVTLARQHDDDERERNFAIADALNALRVEHAAAGGNPRHVAEEYARRRGQGKTSVYDLLRVGLLFGEETRERFLDLSWRHFLLAATRSGKSGESEAVKRERALAVLEWASENGAGPAALLERLAELRGEEDARATIRRALSREELQFALEEADLPKLERRALAALLDWLFARFTVRRKGAGA